jgi:hypothetical protein
MNIFLKNQCRQAFDNMAEHNRMKIFKINKGLHNGSIPIGEY